jgi:hypothetical protein
MTTHGDPSSMSACRVPGGESGRESRMTIATLPMVVLAASTLAFPRSALNPGSDWMDDPADRTASAASSGRPGASEAFRSTVIVRSSGAGYARDMRRILVLTLALASTAAAPLPMVAAEEPLPISPPSATAPSPPLPTHLKDRGPGLSTTLFGTYIRRGEWIVYPFFEYYRDDDREYKPSELGYEGEQDFRGRYRASEGLLYLGYGLTDDLALEFEAAVIDATLEKSPEDASDMPTKLEASGLGDIDAHLLWRWRRETEHRPELYSFLKVAFPRRGTDPLIATPDWELGLGMGIIRGFGWGTVTVRAGIEYAAGSTSEFDIGEYAVEYLKQLSPKWRLYAGVEGTQDELSLITEVQWHLSSHVTLKLNSGFGLTSKASDWEPEVGILFRLPTR